ncbi:MAG: glutamate-1-semialdehyde 2,1-aminomutase [Chitinophagales bacterium]
MHNNIKSKKLYQEALGYFPGGVNSPVRAFKSVNGTPLFIKKGDGCRMTDEDNHTYIDFCCSWGPLILGHNHPKVKTAIIEAVEKGTSFGTPTAYGNKLAKLILANNRFIEKIRFVSSGTEAVMSAIRLARGATGKNKVIKFEGCYHGHVDHLLVKAGSGLVTFGVSSSAGVPESFARETIVIPLNDADALSQAFEDYKDDIAAVIVEPIPANNGLLLQDKSFLELLRAKCTEYQSMLIFDEVISGFRVGFEGAAGYYNIAPDIITYGKIIGGGMPVGAYGASKEIMGFVAPDGPVYQAGTLSANPVAMAAGAAQLQECLAENFYEGLEEKTKIFVDTINGYAKEKGYPFHLFSIGSIFWIAFTDADKVQRSDQIEAGKMNYFKELHQYLLENGVYIGPSGYEVGFVSSAHSTEDLERAAVIMCQALDNIF